MTERELATLCKQGDKDAYRTLYEAYSQTLMGVVLRYTGDADIAADVLHDSFIKIFMALGQYNYRGEGSLRAWATKIAVNTAIAFLKKNKEVYLNDLSHIIEEDNTEFDAEKYEDLSDELLMDSIRSLPIGYRTVLNMYMFEDMSHSQISQLLGITEATSRVRLNRAKSMLAEKLKKYVKG